MKILKIILIAVGSLVALVAVLLTVGYFILFSPSMQSRVRQEVTELLSDRLGTKVSIDSVRYDFLRCDLQMFSMEVLDQKGVKMLEVDTVHVSMSLRKLLRKYLEINEAELLGCRVKIYKIAPDTVANYQFIVDSLKPQPKDSATPHKKRKYKKIELDINNIKLRNIELEYETRKLYRPPIARKNQAIIKLQQAMAKGKNSTVNGQQEEYRWLLQKIRLKELTYKRRPFGRNGKGNATIRGLHYWNDNGLPRKNTGKKHRGWFDAKHMDVDIDMDIDVRHVGSDRVDMALQRCTAKDSVTGLDVRDLHFAVSLRDNVAHISDLVLTQVNTTIQIDTVTMVLPSKKKGIKLSYNTSTIKGKTLLKDISRMFAPDLSQFSMPVELTARVEGADTAMQFKDIYVYTPDKKIEVNATGYISDMLNKYDMVVHFDVNKMRAKGDIKRKIINQFPVKKFMMKQVDMLGLITYKGNFEVLWKKVQFEGRLDTELGGLNFNFYLDVEPKYLVGQVAANNINLKKVTDNDKLGNLKCEAQFKFDISKPRTALMRKKIRGKLPMGSIKAKVHEANYKKMKFSNIHADIVSNGAIAEGDVQMKGAHVDVLCKFSFTNTDSISKMKVKPGIRFHKMTEEYKAARDKEKAEKAAEKKAAKEAKAAEKKAAKEAKAAEKKAAKEAKKAAKAKAKAEKKANKS